MEWGFALSVFSVKSRVTAVTWKCSVCSPTTQRRKRQMAVLAFRNAGLAVWKMRRWSGRSFHSTCVKCQRYVGYISSRLFNYFVASICRCNLSGASIDDWHLLEIQHWAFRAKCPRPSHCHVQDQEPRWDDFADHPGSGSRNVPAEIQTVFVNFSPRNLPYLSANMSNASP